MIVVQGRARIHPDDLATLREAAQAMIAATRAEPGCIAYAYGEDMHEPGLIHVSERWRDDAALQAHFQTPHMAAFNAVLAKERVLEIKVSAFEAGPERVLMGG